MTQQEMINTALMVAVFVLVFSAWCICVIIWLTQYSRRRRYLIQQLGLSQEEATRTEALQLWREESRMTGTPRDKENMAERLQRLQSDAGWKTPAFMVLLTVAGLTAFSWIIVGLAFGFGIGAMAAFISLFVFYLVTQRTIIKRQKLFERQLTDALGLAARALRAGHPLISSFQLIAEEIDDPVGPLFGDICQEQSMGIDLESCMRKTAKSSRNTELKLFSTSVGIQMKTGGNLADLMETLTRVMRGRMALHRRIRVLTAEARLSRNIIGLMPFICFLLLNALAPEYMQVFFTTNVGHVLMCLVFLFIGLGLWLMSKLTQIKY